MAFDATVGGTGANSYITQDDAQLYFDDRLDTDLWEIAVNEDNADAALMMACTLLEGERYAGCPASTTQALAWPRSFVYIRNVLQASDAIPACVQAAQCELALALLKDPDALSPSGLEAFDNLQLGGLNVTPRGVPAAFVPRFVRRLLAPVLLAGTPVVRA